MITLDMIIFMLLIHWLADFVLQTHNQATKKSTSWKALLGHTLSYAGVWFVALSFFFPAAPIIIFVAITFVAHTITDYITSREAVKLHKKGDIHNFFVVIGFDQILHYAQLLITFILIF